MANPYRELLSVPGARLFVPAALVGRMQMSMIGIGIVLLVSLVTGSYGIAGSVSATCTLSFSVFTPFIGRLTDRHGQQRVLVPLLSLQALSMTAFVGCAWLHAPTWTFFPTAAAVGACSPSLGAMVRARWSYVLRGTPAAPGGEAGSGPDTASGAAGPAGGPPGPAMEGASAAGAAMTATKAAAGPAGDPAPVAPALAGGDSAALASRLQAAYSFESVLDEVVFVTGPLIVTMLVTLVHPLAGVTASGLLLIGGGLALAVQRATQPPPAAHRRGPGAGAIKATGMLTVTGVFLLLGAVFGSVDVSLIAFAKEQGHQSLAGVMVGTYALGSGVAGLWYGGRRWKAPLDHRFATGLMITALGLVPLSLMPGITPMIAVIFFAGTGISPTIISGYGLVERLVPGHQLTEGLTWISTAVGVGVAAGATVAGRLVDAQGSWAGLVAALAAALTAAGIGIGGRSRVGAGLRVLEEKEPSPGVDTGRGTGAGTAADKT